MDDIQVLRLQAINLEATNFDLSSTCVRCGMLLLLLLLLLLLERRD